ncbi:ribonuclease H family protein [Bifidobacterium vansinderenii]|uniref:ribonuclease H n=1 Tax=Bifidobacterium vansinderenii TaxID=1984871 RepID=A0A229VZY8_9BIFI|nr:ribonuclease H [Bifidobacterium vansinderenii]OXN01171.1 ribonuclease H [Bifidobacterium vansinderenii]
MTITVSTDGSALGNPNGPMGWAWADHEAHAGGRPGHEHGGDCDAGGATNGTNQIGELCAVLEALRAHPGEEPLVIETDSQYAINCSTKWVHGWKRNGWRNSQKKPVKNAAVIKAIDVEISKRPGSVKFVWVKGHAGNAGNEKVDELARTYAEDCRSGVRDGYLPREGWESLLASEYSKGTDVPADAQMLMDGQITAAEYHLGHGEDTGGVTGGDESGATSVGARSATTSGKTRKTMSDTDRRSSDGKTGERERDADSLAQRLAGREGVPELADFSSGSSATESSATAMSTDSTNTSNATVNVSMESGRIGGTDDGTAHAARVTATTEATSMATTLGDNSHDMRTMTAVHQTAAPTQQQPHRATGTGLHASGRVRITPPPSSSPSFSGGTITISGTITFTGTVDADGYMQLDGDVTIMPHR